MSRRPFKELSRRLRAPLHRLRGFRRLRQYHARPRTLEETVEWAMSFGGNAHFKINTLQIPYEITTLARRVQALNPRLILEIGTSRAGTLLIWSALASERVITCDLRDFSVAGVGDLFRALPPPQSRCQVELLTGDSHSPEFKRRVAEALKGEQVDFLFIDGDHTVAGVAQDYQDYKGFVRPGGIIAFHDIVERQPLADNQVYQFWRTIRDGLEVEEVIADPHQLGFGIGIVYVR